MSLCEHGYTAHYDCPHCLCPCGLRPMFACGTPNPNGPACYITSEDAPLLVPTPPKDQP